MLFLVEVFALCLPATFNRSPLVYPDTRAYFMGGKAAIEKIASLLPHQSSEAGIAIVDTVQKARGVRSAFYSLFTYVPAVSVSLWAVIILQAMIVAWVVGLAFRLMCPQAARWQRCFCIVNLSILTTVSWATSNVMPDIFTAVMALGIAIVVVFWPQLGRMTRVGLFVAIAGSVVMHLTNLPMAMGLTLLAAVVLQPIWRHPARYGLIVAALVSAIVAMLAVGVGGFHEWTLAPQSPPFLTARSLQDGPGRLYLLSTCPESNFDMCQHLDKVNQTTEKFIWDEDGVYSAVSPDEEARMRAEDKRFFITAAKAYPWLQIKAMGENAVTQLIKFSMHEYYIPSWATYDRTSITLHLPPQAPWQWDSSLVEYAVVIFSLALLALWWRKLSPSARQMVVMVAATVILEAMAGAVSEPAPRYEARVIWLIPMVAYFAWIAMRRNRHA